MQQNARVEKNRSKSRNLSNEHLFVLFRGYRYTSMIKHSEIGLSYLRSRILYEWGLTLHQTNSLTLNIAHFQWKVIFDNPF
jgi:hypothetical protein